MLYKQFKRGAGRATTKCIWGGLVMVRGKKEKGVVLKKGKEEKRTKVISWSSLWVGPKGKEEHECPEGVTDGHRRPFVGMGV